MYRKCISRISTKKQFGQIILLSFEEAEKRKIENLLRVAWRQSGTKQHQQIQKKKHSEFILVCHVDVRMIESDIHS